MKILLKLSLSTVLLIIATTSIACFYRYKPKFKPHKAKNFISFNKTDGRYATLQRLKQKAALAVDFVKANHYNTTRCFLIDMKVPSGNGRFFVYNLLKDSIEKTGLVTHGSGSNQGKEELYFSNTVNSNCTSLGKYQIGKSYIGKYGLSYKLHGLDITNSKAFERFIVLHSHACVPNEEVAPYPICESWGCPTVAPVFLKALKTYIDNSAEPILLWIYY